MHRRSRHSSFVAIAAGLVIVLAIALAACGSSPTTTSASAGAKTLTVSAASSLKDAFTEIGKAFDAANGSVTTFNFDGSGVLEKQVEGGAPVDVFASAAAQEMTALTGEKLVDAASIKNIGTNGMVLVVPAGSTLGLTSFQDLAKATVRKIGYGDPKAAAHGIPAEEILNSLGIFDQVRLKVVYAQSAAQATGYVASGEVDAGIMFATEAKAAGDKIKVVATADVSSYTPIAYPMALVSASKVKDLGQAFIDFVTGAEGQSILAEHGFLPAPADTAPTSSS